LQVFSTNFFIKVFFAKYFAKKKIDIIFLQIIFHNKNVFSMVQLLQKKLI